MQGFLENIAHWNLVVSGVAILLTLASFAQLGIAVHIPLLVVVGVGSFLVYTLDRRLPFSPEDGPGKAGLDGVGFTALLASPFLAAYACLRLRPSSLVVVAVLAICSVTYILPLLPGRRRLKDVPYLKSVFVLLGWGAATVILPAAQSGHLPGRSAGFLLVYRLFFLTPNLLLSDWPDRDDDLRAGIRTVANQSGERELVGRCLASAIVGGGLAAVGVWFGYLPWWVLTELPALAILLLLARPPLPMDRRFYLLVVDGLAGWPGIPAIVACMGWL
jgi:4-hydroxybenzoate polyprenyltransferase